MPTTKKSSTKTSSSRKIDNHMQQKPFPLPVYRKGTKVQVFLGAGWSVGIVLESSQEKCFVQLKNNNRNISVFDARSIKEMSA